MEAKEDIVVVHKARSRGEAEIVRALLEEAGIPAMISDQNSPLPAIDLTPLDGEYTPTGCEVLVAAKDEKDAREIIREAREAAAESSEDEGVPDDESGVGAEPE